ncbi:hypothetical protein OG905_20795 [Streptomyces sp. NBC_00322]|uniref:hypothetical protein n=1 Tax=Streptomyces sp. NBC_00322 TaxID=2975712 RepID=UPI002E2E6636|nr:hypothetical protein [Streptomyces sp. NBC_00322]
MRRHDPEPVSIGWIDWCNEEYVARRSAYRSERDDLLPEIPRMPDGEGRQLLACCACMGVTLLLSFWCLAAVLLVMARPHGVLEWAAAAAAAAGLTALWFADDAHQAVRARTACEDPLGDRTRAELHPSLAALDEQQRFHVLRSIGDHSRWRGTDRVLSEGGDEDDDWLDDDWWPDAYHYRATDQEEEPDCELHGDARGTPPGTCPPDQATASLPAPPGEMDDLLGPRRRSEPIGAVTCESSPTRSSAGLWDRLNTYLACGTRQFICRPRLVDRPSPVLAAPQTSARPAQDPRFQLGLSPRDIANSRRVGLRQCFA